MSDRPQPEFLILLEQYREMKTHQDSRTIMSARRLMEIRNNIEACDQKVESQREKFFLFTAYKLWRKSLSDWERDTPPGDENEHIPDILFKTKKFPGQETHTRQITGSVEEPDPEKRFEESLNDVDKKFLENISKGKFKL